MLFLLVLSVAVPWLLYSHLFYCHTVGFSDFVRVAPDLYVSPLVSQDQRETLRQAYRESSGRILQFWGERKGRAVVILCHNTQEYQRYCHSREGAGCSLGTPYGSAFIVLNLHGLNTDVLSHEMCHDELFSRLGWWRATFKVPQWFHEGLALMLDRRFVTATDSVRRYREYRNEWHYRLRGPVPPLPLKTLRSMRGFFGGNQQNVIQAYITAGTEVSRWLMHAGRPGLFRLIDALNNGAPFADAYSRIEKEALPVRARRPVSLLPPAPLLRAQKRESPKFSG